MYNIDIRTITEVLGGEYHGPEEILTEKPSGLVSDSRKVQEGYIYAAIQGARADGHDFMASAAEKGAICAIAEKKVETDVPYILVESTTDAMRTLAEYYRLHTDIKVVGITGSVGKTSTKETIARVLEQKYRVHKTEANYNNEIGVPLTVFGVNEEHQVLVLEMGISHFGDMDVIGRIGRPDIAVITNIGNCHLEYLKDRDGVLKEKSEIFKWMAEGGTGIVNGDDDKLSTIKDIRGKAPVYCGLVDEGNDYHASDIVSKGLKGSDFTIYGPGEFKEGIRVHIPVPGIHMVQNSVIACGVAVTMGLTAEEIRKGLAGIEALNGRGRIISTSRLDIMDSCYNANPASMRASLDVLKVVDTHTTAILGDMFELGDNEAELHRQVGAYAVESGVDTLICLGELSSHMYDGAVEALEKLPEVNCQVLYFKDRESFIKAADEILEQGDTVLVKASHGMELEHVIEALEELS